MKQAVAVGSFSVACFVAGGLYPVAGSIMGVLAVFLAAVNVFIALVASQEAYFGFRAIHPPMNALQLRVLMGGVVDPLENVRVYTAQRQLYPAKAAFVCRIDGQPALVIESEDLV